MGHSMSRERKMNRMDDLISRQAAIDALNGEFTVTGRKNAETIRDYISDVDKKLRELPSAERHGRWIYLCGLDAFECSVCGRQMVRNIFNYCPWCGAKMDEVTEW